MHPTLTLRPRAAGFTISRATSYGFSEIEEAANRLKSWAVIMGIPIRGNAFVRLSSDLTAFVHLPVDRAIDTSHEDGVVADSIAEAQISEGLDITFDEMRIGAAALRNEVAMLGEISGHVEYHAGPDGMRTGTLVVPVAQTPGAVNPALAA